MNLAIFYNQIFSYRLEYSFSNSDRKSEPLENSGPGDDVPFAIPLAKRVSSQSVRFGITSV